MMHATPIISAMVALLALAGCASLQEQRTMRIAFCNAAPPVILAAGERVAGLDVFAAIRNRQPERIVLSAESGPLALTASMMAKALQQDPSVARGVLFADGAADRAQAARLCGAAL